MAGFLDTYLPSITLPIILRNPEPQDAAAMSALLSEPSNVESDPHMPPNGLDEATCSTVIARMRESASAEIPTRVNLLIVYTSTSDSDPDGIVIGMSGFGGIDEINGKRFADAGAVLFPEYRGYGYAVEAMRLSIDFAFNELKVDGVSAQVLEKNEKMKNLLEKKFDWVGIKAESKYGPELRFEMNEEQWNAMKTRFAWS